MPRSQRLIAIAASFLLVVGVATAAQRAGDTGTPEIAAGPPSPTATVSSPTGSPAAGPSPTTPTPTEGGSPTGVGATGGTGTPGGTTGGASTTTGGATGTTGATTGGTSSTTTAGTGGTSTTTGTTGGTSGGTGGGGSTGGWPSSGLFTPEEDRVGITDTTIRLCMHAAFLLGPVFDNRPQDEDVYWRWLNDRGGIHGRKVEIVFTDDQYTPSGAAQAAAACDDADPFLMLGGVGFDQTPTVRNYAEEHRIPYIYSMAVSADPATLNYSYTGIPTIEQVGTILAQRVATAYAGRKVGIIWVNSENWKAGRDAFVAELQRRGQDGLIVFDRAIPNNNEQFTPHIIDMRNAGVEVLYFHANALAMARFFKEADAQGYYPVVVGEDGFNLVTDTAGAEMQRFPPAEVVWVTPAYDPADSSTPWYGEIRTMQEAYATYRPGKTPNDVDWMFWLAFKSVHRMLEDCGPDCTRNTLTGMLKSGYRASVPPMCEVDFSRGGGHFGGYLVNLYRSAPRGDTSVWTQAATCVPGF